MYIIDMDIKKIQLTIVGTLLILLLSRCSKEGLSHDSVVDNHWENTPKSEIDQWITQKFSPYNIEVLYRWDKSHLPAGTIAYPPNPEKIPAVLETIYELLFETYSTERGGGSGFMKDKGIIRIILLGGYDTMSNKVLLKLWNDRATTNEIYVYGVNDFDPKDPQKVYLLMRSIHHQFAKRLTEYIPYDRDEFAKISSKNYGSMGLTPSESQLFKRVGISSYALRKGFYTLHSMSHPQDDFAEIITTLLLHSAVEIKEVEDKAAIPFDPSSPESIKAAEDANSTLVNKRLFVEKYFKEKVGINLRRLQLESLKRIALYNKEHSK